MDKKTDRAVRWFGDVGNDDVSKVGGKNASLGEMIRTLKEKGIRVPDGFATTAEAYREYLRANKLVDKIEDLLEDLEKGEKSLSEVGKSIRDLIENGDFPEPIRQSIEKS